jgi:hypothetical protein
MLQRSIKVGIGSGEWKVESQKSKVESIESELNFPLSTFHFPLFTFHSPLPIPHALRLLFLSACFESLLSLIVSPAFDLAQFDRQFISGDGVGRKLFGQ